MIRPDVLTSTGGTGPAIMAQAGALAAVRARTVKKGGIGVSGGAALEAAAQYGVDDYVILRKISDAMTSGGLLRPSASALWTGGILDWGVMGELVRSLIGDAEMGEAAGSFAVCVTPLDGGGPLYISKLHHPKVLVHEAVEASMRFKVGVTGAGTIPSLMLGRYTPGIALYVDGGRTNNTCDEYWDAKDEPRVALRLKDQPTNRRVREGDVAGMLLAEELVSCWAANQIKSRRTDGLVIDVDGVNDWRFDKTAAELEKEWQDGYDSAARHSPWFLGVANPTGSLIG